jgi:hypothetical protein
MGREFLEEKTVPASTIFVAKSMCYAERGIPREIIQAVIQRPERRLVEAAIRRDAARGGVLDRGRAQRDDRAAL